MLCGWEGNRRSGVALAMCHRLKWFVHLRAHGLYGEMSTPPIRSLVEYVKLHCVLRDLFIKEKWFIFSASLSTFLYF